MSSQCVTLGSLLLYDDVMKAADTGFHPRGQCPISVESAVTQGD
ncbi:hypothetical protein [Wolbachia endosymbiont (group A) of Agelastica alni]